MAYTPFTWHDGPGGGTPIVASRLNAIEQGIADAHDVTDALEDLSSYVPGIIRSAVVDHNLDVPGGFWDVDRYIRYESGLQFCWGKFDAFLWDHFETQTLQNINQYSYYFKVLPPASLTYVISFDLRFDGFDDVLGEMYLGIQSVSHNPNPDQDGNINYRVTTLSNNIIEWYNNTYFAVGWWL